MAWQDTRQTGPIKNFLLYYSRTRCTRITMTDDATVDASENKKEPLNEWHVERDWCCLVFNWTDCQICQRTIVLSQCHTHSVCLLRQGRELQEERNKSCLHMIFILWVFSVSEKVPSVVLLLLLWLRVGCHQMIYQLVKNTFQNNHLFNGGRSGSGKTSVTK